MVVTAIFRTKPGKEVEFRKQLHVGASESWNELGVRAYAVHEVIDQPGTFMNIEVYESAEAFAQHLATPHVKAFLEILDDFLLEPLTVFQGTSIFGQENSKATL